MRRSAIIELRLPVSKQTLRFGQLYCLHLVDVLCISLILIRAAACIVFFVFFVFFQACLGAKAKPNERNLVQVTTTDSSDNSVTFTILSLASGRKDQVNVNPLTPKIWFSILPSGYYTFPCKLITRIRLFNQGNKLYLMSLSILTTWLDTIVRS